jgi:hypothetical protein
MTTISDACGVGKSTLRARWPYRRPMSHHLDRIAGAIGLRLIRFAARKSNMLLHAKDEWKISFPEKEEMQDAVGRSVFDVVAVFSLEGHSGFSAAYTVNFIEKALRFDPFSPLQGIDSEWTQVADDMWQNKRLSSVFKDGIYERAYDIDGVVYREPSGACYTKGGARNYIEFPYVQPPTKYIDVDEDGVEIPTIEKECAAALRKEASITTGKQKDLFNLAAGLLEKI